MAEDRSGFNRLGNWCARAGLLNTWSFLARQVADSDTKLLSRMTGDPPELQDCC